MVLLTTEQEKLKEVLDAKKKEIENMTSNDVYECVPYTGQKTVSTKWVITEKIKNAKKIVKARLVAKGFEEDSRNLKTDSPTCSRESMRLVMLTASLMNWKLQTLDFTSAFLQGDSINREVFLKLPPDVGSENEVWRLKRCIYGLNDAPRSWYEKVYKVLNELKGVRSIYDNALFMWHDDNMNLIGVLVMHVDDFELTGNGIFEKNVVSVLKKRLKVGSHETKTFKFLGLNVRQNQNGITVDQDLYTSSISEIFIKKERLMRKNDELNDIEKSELKRLSGQMLWVTTQTRPDLAFDVGKISNAGKHPKVKLLSEANKVLIKLKSKTGSIYFPNLGKPSDLKVLCYSDATYASLEDGSSQGGFVILVQGVGDKLAPICWSSKRLERVTKSPLASETLALSEAADAGLLIGAMLQEIFKLCKLPNVLCKTDNSSLVDTLNTTNLVSDKRLRIDISRIKEMKNNNEIEIHWIRGREQVSDCLTKAGASTEILRNILHQ